MAVRVESILFATDLSENSRHAFQYASTLAGLFNARIVLLHVMSALPSGVRAQLDLVAGEGTTQRIRENHRKEAKEILIGKRTEDRKIRSALSEFYGRGEAGAFDQLEIVIREGDIDEEIVEVASEFGCSLIVLGSHKGFLGGTALGAKTKDVLHRSTVPVLIVPPPEAT